MKRRIGWSVVGLVAVALLAPPRVMKAAGPPAGFTDQSLVSGLNSATAIAAAPDGRLFVCEQGGRLRVINGGVLLPTPFLTFTADSSGERGLLGVALHPGFATNNKIYVYHTVPGNPAHNRVSEYLADGDVAVGGSATPTEIAHFDIDNLTAATNHNGGALHFGRNAPGDFKLIVAVGDNATGLAAPDPAASKPQRLDNLLGKILRLNDDLTIPTDNPFFGSTTGNNRAILAIGLRNPFTFGMAKEGVDVAPPHVFINDVGQNTWEEIDEGLPGANYGWPVVEGPAPAAVPGMTYPIFSYNHSTGSPTGATVIGGAFVDSALGRFPGSMAGDYFFGDHASGWIKTLHESPPGTFQVQDFDDGNAPVGFTFGPDGRLYYTVFSGVRVIDYTPSGAPAITAQPQDVHALAGTGAVVSVAASGSGLSYQWFKNGVSIPGANADTYLLPDTGSGRYHCIVTNASGRDLSRVATVTIDTAATFRFSAANYTVSEAAASALITVTRIGTVAGATVHYATSDGTATTAGLDYTQTSGTLTFAANQKALVFKVPILKDTIHEGSETVLLSLDTPEPAAQGAGLGSPSTAVLTITDNDVGGKVQFASAAYSVNAAAAAGAVKLTLRRTGGLASEVTVHCTMTDVTAVGGVDYDNTPQDVTFLPSGLGATIQTLTVSVLQNLTEAKTFKVTLNPPSGGAILGTPTVSTVTILGAEPTLSFSSATYNVKTTGSRALITVKRSAPLTGTVRVHYNTTAGTAVPVTDYTDVNGDLVFGPKVSVRMFAVPIVKDPLVDTPKTVNLTLSNPTWSLGTAALDGALATSLLTIQNPNLPPTIQFSAATYTVNEAMPKATITVRRTGDLAGTVTVPYHAVAGGTAQDGVDYTLDAGTLTFGPNQTLRTFPISIVNDAEDEGTETVDLALDPPTWTGGTAVIGANGSATLNITDNESTVQFGAAAYSASEAAKLVIVTARRTGPLTPEATVSYDVTLGGTAVRDTGSGGDYSLAAPGILTFAPGQSLKTLPITLNPDTVADGTKTIDLALTALTGAEVGTPGSTIVTIKDNDLAGTVKFSASDYSVSEGGGTATITVARVGGVSSEATIDYATADGSAQDGVDYTLTTGTLTFGLGEKSKTFAVPILDDTVANPGVKSLSLTLSDPANGLALATPSTATLWIVKE